MRIGPIALAAVIAVTSIRIPIAGADRFEPLKHFPPRPLIFLAVESVSGLKAGLASTLAGRIATHPGTREACARPVSLLLSKVEEETAHIKEALGKSLLEILALFEGGVALCVPGISPQSGPEAAAAVELGATREEILALYARIRSIVEEEAGPLEKATVEGVETELWPGPTGPLHHAVLGTHLVFATSPSLWQEIVRAWKGDGAAPSEASKGLAVPNRQVLFTVNLEVARNLAMVFAASEAPVEDIEKFLEVSGLVKLDRLELAAGFEDGGGEVALHLGAREGLSGALDVIRSGFLPLTDPAAAVGLFPDHAGELQAVRVAPGQMLRGLDALVRERYPEHAGDLDALYEELEQRFGVSLTNDVFTLPEIEAYAFSALPPAGGLADTVALARTEAVEPYWRLLEKAGAAFGVEARPLAGGKVRCWSLASAQSREATLLERLIEQGPGWQPSWMEVSALLASGAGLTIARADLEGGWTAFSDLPQAVLRYVSHYGRGRKLAATSDLAGVLQARAQGASFASAVAGGRDVLACYNLFVTVAGKLAGVLAMAGIDAAALPPAEEFLEHAKLGFLRFVAAKDGFTLHGRRALESTTGVLVPIAAGSVAAGFLVPTLMRSRGEAFKVQCMNNLKQLYGMALLYSTKEGGNAFPHSPEGALAALQALVDFDDDGALLPKVFVCPEGNETVATPEAGKVVLSAETCSYEIVPWRLKNTAVDSILMYDKQPHHRGQRNVLFTDGTTTVMEEPEFQAKLAADRERFEKPPEDPAPRKKSRKVKKARREEE